MLNLMSMMEEDRMDSDYGDSRPPTREEIIKQKKAQVRKLLENDNELLNEVITDLRSEKIQKIRNKK